MAGVDRTERRKTRSVQVALSLATLLLLVNPLVLGLFLRLDPDGVFYILTWDAVLFLLLICSLAFIRTKHPRYRRAFLAVLLVAPFVLIASEMILSQWRIRRIDAWRPQTIEGVYEPHPTLGWRPIPDARGRHVSEGNFDATYAIDSLGRKAIPKSHQDAPTLHFFGDSYAFGHGVDNAETALNLLAEGFAKDQGFNVANYAVMGYGLEQMLTALRLHRASIEQGDLVIFLPTSFDLARNMIHRRFLCSFPIKKNTPVGGLSMRRDGRWETVDLDEDCGPLENLFLQSNFAFGALYHPIRDRNLRPALLDNADAILLEAEDLAAEAGASFTLLFLAAPWECGKGRYDFDLSGLRSEFLSMLEHCPDFELRFPTDSHWSPEGHRWVARFLSEQLQPVLSARKPLQ